MMVATLNSGESCEIKPPERAMNETHAAMLEAWTKSSFTGGCDIFNRGFLAGVEYAVSRIWEGENGGNSGLDIGNSG